MALTELQKKTYLNDINRSQKKIIDLGVKYKKDVAALEKHIADIKNKLIKG